MHIFSQKHPNSIIFMHKYDFSPQKKENIATQEHFEFTSNPMILISIFLQKPSINTNLS